MDLPKISLGEGGVLNGIKSKLGFSNDKDEPLDDDYYYDDEYDDDYDDYDDDVDDYDDDYDDDDDYEEEDSRSDNRFGRAAFQRLRNRVMPDSSRGAQPKRSSVRSVSSNLVNIDDVRARKRAADSFDDADRRASYGQGIGSRRGFASDAADAESSFEAPRAAFDPYNAFSGEGEAAHAPLRSLSVIRPAAYSEVEQVARCLRAGDMVILSMKTTPGDLAKRVLDFSFGAASMVDARVECVGDKVFALSTGVALTDEEKAHLISQGVL